MLFKTAGKAKGAVEGRDTIPNEAPAESIAASTAAPAGIEGFVDLVDSHRILGWAFDSAAPERRVLIEVSAAGASTVSIASIERPDLRDAGKGDGFCGFEATFDVEAAGGSPIHIRDVSTGEDLVGSPVSFDLLHLLLNPSNRSRLDTLRSEAQLAFLTLKGLRR